MRHARLASDLEMTSIARKSDGRRIFTDAFKRQQVGHVLRGELTLAELGRRLGIARSLLQRWKRTMPQRDGNAVVSRRRANPAGESGSIREVQRLIGKQTVELELLRAELATLKKARSPRISKP